MKRFSFILFALLVVIASTAVAEEKIKIISGYGIKEFAVKGIILDQVKILTAMIKAAQPDSTYTLFITVIGSADSVGTSAENDRLSKDRAESVAAELESNFPGVKPIVAPHGDEENKRQVTVKYEFLKSAPDKSLVEINTKLDSLAEQRPDNRGETRLIIIVLVVFAVIIFVLIKRRDHRSSEEVFSPGIEVPSPGIEVPSPGIEVPWEEKIIWLDIVTKSCGVYSVKILYKWRTVKGTQEKSFISPFKSETGRDIQASKERDIKRSLRHGIEDGNFTSQIDPLIQSGKVIKKS